jgi:hypothetical protein
MRLGPFSIIRQPKVELAIVTPKPKVNKTTLGASGVSEYGIAGEYNSALEGQEAITMYEKMRRSDATCAAILYAIKAPLLGAQWYVDPLSTDPMDLEIAAFVEYALFTGISERPFMDVLEEMLNTFDYGHYAFEKVYDYGTWDNKGKITDVVLLRDLAARHPRTIESILYDENGRFAGIKQSTTKPNGDIVEVEIPKERLLFLTFREEAGDKFGISVLRQAYKSWYFQEHLYKIDAIQKERHALGIPTFYLPMGFNETDKAAADEMGRNMRTNEKTHITLPPNWEFEFKAPGTLIDVLTSIRHHNTSIAKTVLAQFLAMGTEGSGGSRSLGDVMTKLFYRAWRFAGLKVCAAFNQQVIPELVRFNYDTDRFPVLKVRKVGEEAEWRAMATALNSLVSADILQPDEPLEEWLREEMGAPVKDPTTVRETETKTPALPPSDTPEEREDSGAKDDEREQDRQDQGGE